MLVFVYYRLEYDNKTRTTLNSPGVDIVVPGFGDTETVEWLDHSQISLSRSRCIQSIAFFQAALTNQAVYRRSS